MLDTFTIRRTFGKLSLYLYVDCARNDASALATYDGRIFLNTAVQFHKVASPEAAERWLSRDMPDSRESGAVINWVENLERIGRNTIAERDATPRAT